MSYTFVAQILVVVHLGFIAFALAGGLLVLRFPWIVWLHLPAALWCVVVAMAGWICPLTPLENALRRAAGEPGYSGGFVDQYVVPLVYPVDLTREFQIVLGLCLLGLNGVIYAFVIRRARRASIRGSDAD